MTYSLGGQDGVWASGRGYWEEMLGNGQDLPWSASLCHVASYIKHKDLNLQGSWCKVCSKEIPMNLAGLLHADRIPGNVIVSIPFSLTQLTGTLGETAQQPSEPLCVYGTELGWPS